MGFVFAPPAQAVAQPEGASRLCVPLRRIFLAVGERFAVRSAEEVSTAPSKGAFTVAHGLNARRAAVDLGIVVGRGFDGFCQAGKTVWGYVPVIAFSTQEAPAEPFFLFGRVRPYSAMPDPTELSNAWLYVNRQAGTDAKFGPAWKGTGAWLDRAAAFRRLLPGDVVLTGLFPSCAVSPGDELTAGVQGAGLLHAIME